jgi:hypothetical protein
MQSLNHKRIFLKEPRVEGVARGGGGGGGGDDDIIKMDEFDGTTGNKVRTLSTGYTFSSGCTIRSVLANDTAVYCFIVLDNGHMVIQSFLP